MSVSSVNPYSQAYSAYSSNTGAAASANATASSAQQDEEAAVYEKSEPEAAKQTTYTKDAETISRLKKDLAAHKNQLREMVVKMLTKQGLTAKDILGGAAFKVDEETRAAAEAEIGEDGYWGVKQTSERIVSFAKGLTGGDPSKVGVMRDAIIKGFDQAKAAWGGELPEICQQTYDAVMKELDAWEKGE